jgi:FAD/FMN-containing dehydrogenase
MDGLQQALQSQIEGEVRFDKISRALYSTDASVYQIMPRGVVIPRTADDVLRTVNVCRELGVSITARGGGTSQAGQACGQGIQLDFSKYLNRLLELVPDAKTVTVEPGIVLDELNAFLQPYGLHLPLDLSTSNRATIGGMIANNSSGTRSVVYGKTLDYVEQLTVILADGSVVELQALSADELDDRCRSNDSGSDCHRVVRKLAAEHADEIRRRYPQILRRVGGYNLDEFVDGNKPFNLSRLIVGSEGTLAIITKAKLRIVPLPKARGICVVQFETLLDALAATPFILEHSPSAVELMDRFILDTTRGKREFEPLREFLVGDPAAILIVEFFGETPDELPERFDQLETDLRSRGCGRHFHRAMLPDAQARIWKLRRAALGLSMSQRGDGKAISFVEDTAVAPGRLRDYIQRFTAILDEHDTQAGFYAHASVGLLHIRPVVNLKTSRGVETFARIAEQVAELVLEFGGALSGEHGDGLVRSPFQQKMYGPELYNAFCEIKRTFDPHNLLNPGKIVNAPPLAENLRFGTGYETRQLETAFDFSDFGGISRAAEQCGGVGACRKTLTGSMCPSYMATRDEADSTRGRANALRLAISGQLGPDAMTDRELFRVLDLCLEDRMSDRRRHGADEGGVSVPVLQETRNSPPRPVTGPCRSNCCLGQPVCPRLELVGGESDPAAAERGGAWSRPPPLGSAIRPADVSEMVGQSSGTHKLR